MPINVRRVKHNDQYRELYKKSLVDRKKKLYFRNNNNNNSNKSDSDENDTSTASELITIEQASIIVADLLSAHETNSQLLHQRNNLCAMIRKMGKNVTIEQRNELEELEELYIRSVHSFQLIHEILPNIIDFDIPQQYPALIDDTMMSSEIFSNNDKSFDDDNHIMFCIRGYEEIKGSNNNNNNNNNYYNKINCNPTYLTTNGINLMNGLRQYILKTILQWEINNNQQQQHQSTEKFVAIEIINFPSYLEIAKSDLRKIFPDQNHHRSERPWNENEVRTTIFAPSWITLLLQQQQFSSNTIYTDRQLPILYVINCCSDLSSTINNNKTEENIIFSDPREVDRKMSQRRNGKRKVMNKHHLPWYERLVSQRNEIIQLLAITGPSLEADSRPLQLTMMEDLKLMFEQLICNDNKPINSNYTCEIEIRSIHPKDLLPSESSRLVIVATIQSNDDNKANRITTKCLAYLSNFQDFIRSNDMKHTTTKERLHILHGCICSMTETIDWMLQMNLNVIHSDGPFVTIPNVLRLDPTNNYRILLPETIPFSREIVRNKNGDKRVQEIIRSQSRGIVHNQNSDNKGGQHEIRSQIEITTTPTNDELRKLNKLDLVDGNQRPSETQIRHESLTNPFSFLPFYYK